MSHVQFPVEVPLAIHERKVIGHIAKTRYLMDRRNRVRDQRVQYDPFGWKLDLVGFASEFVVAKCLNVFPDFGTQVRTGGVKMRLPSGLTVDVRGTPRANGNLISKVSLGKQYTTDITVLVTGEVPMTADGRLGPELEAVLTVQGWARTTDLIHEQSIRALRQHDGDYIDTYIIDRSRLFKELPTTATASDLAEEYPSIHLPHYDPTVEDDLLDLWG